MSSILKTMLQKWVHFSIFWAANPNQSVGEGGAGVLEPIPSLIGESP